MIECPVCHAVSHHPVDAQTGWCSACNRFTGKTDAEVRAAAAAIALDGRADVAEAILFRLKSYGAKVVTREDFERAYAERCGLTVQELRGHGRIVVRCWCDEPECEGWASSRLVCR